MTLPYVCSTCSYRLVGHTFRSRSKIHAARSSTNAIDDILSEKTTLPQAAHQRTRRTEPSRQSARYSRDESLAARSRNNRSTDSNLDFTTYINSAASRAPGRYSRPQEPASAVSARHSDRRSADRGRDFTAYANSTETRTPGRYSSPRGPARAVSASPTEPDAVGTSPTPRAFTLELEELLNRGTPQEAWAFFQEHYQSEDCPALKTPSLRDVPKLRSCSVFEQLLAECTSAWLRRLQSAHDTLHLPSPADVLDRFEKLGITNHNMYIGFIWSTSTGLSAIISERDNVLEDEPSREVIHDLMKVWERCLSRDFSTKIGKPDAVEHNTTEEPSLSFVRPESWNSKPAAAFGNGYDFWFKVFVPAAKLGGVRSKYLSTSALLTYDILTQAPATGSHYPPEFERYQLFVQSMEQLFAKTVLSAKSVDMFKKQLRHNMSVEAVDALFRRLAAHTTQINNAQSAPKENMPKLQNTSEILRRYVTLTGRALEKQNLDDVEKLWSSARETLRAQTTDSTTAPQRGVYEQFMEAFLQLRRRQSAVDVWNTMTQNGIEPTVSTWTVMMKGCQRVIPMMESLWQRMRASGVQPDLQAWNVRIYGLFRLGSIQDGLRALDEMGREWSQSTRQKTSGRTSHVDSSALSDGNLGGVPKPDIAILNSAISASRSRGAQHLPNVLAWSRSFGIEPDVVTYNALLHVSLTGGKQAEATGILQSMIKANLKPDSDTFTILLNSMLRSSYLQELSHSEQEQHVMNFISSLESNNIRIDGKGYALLIDRLLKEYSNISAVQRILGDMAKRNIEPTPHIYTILMTHYFDSTPPDLYAADALWNQIQSRNRGYGAPLDIIFYDRMVEGYARHGDVGRTMAFLTRMSKEGKRPGWLAMTAVLRCLAEKGDWNRLTQIVHDCHRHEGLLSAGVRGTKGQAEFWQLARELGVLDRLSIDPEEVSYLE